MEIILSIAIIAMCILGLAFRFKGKNYSDSKGCDGVGCCKVDEDENTPE